MIRKTAYLTIATAISDTVTYTLPRAGVVDWIHMSGYFTPTVAASGNVRNGALAVGLRRAAALGISGASKGTIDEDTTIAVGTANFADLSTTVNVTGMTINENFGPGLDIPFLPTELLIFSAFPATNFQVTGFLVVGLWLS